MTNLINKMRKPKKAITPALLKNMHKKLVDGGYLCDKPFSSRVASSMATKPTAGSFLFGPAGTGKSFLPEVVANIVGADHVFYQCFPGTREDDLLVKMLPDEDTTSGIKLFDGPILRAIHLSNNGDGTKPVVLTLDEWDKTRPSADSFLLDFLQNGRVTFQGDEHVANLDRMLVFVTMNDERDLSEPLLRRLPMIEFDHLPAPLVYQALKMTHPESKALNSAIVLYQRCVMSGMSKPATIQELRQLLDAIDALGKEADWDSLVFQFITKTKENHMMLKLSEDEEVDFNPAKDEEEEGDEDEGEEKKSPSDSGKLETSKYEVTEEVAKGLETAEQKAHRAQMPKMTDLKEFDIQWKGKPQLEDIETYGVLRRTSTDYNRIVHLVKDANVHAGDLGNVDETDIVATVSDDDIRLARPISLISAHKITSLFEANGEIMFVEPLANAKDIKDLSAGSDGLLEIIKYAKDEVIAKAPGIHLRCTPELGAEIIVDLDHQDSFNQVFGLGSRGAGSGEKWLAGNTNVDDLQNAVIVSPNKYGIMFQRHYLSGLKGYHKALVKNRYDIWGDGWDTIPTKDIPLLGEFQNEDYRVLQSSNEHDRFYLAGNIVFGFFGEDNDMFGLKILGSFDKKYYKYVKRWVPDEGIEIKFNEVVETNLTGKDLLKESHGFKYLEDLSVYEKQTEGGLGVRFETDSGKISMRANLPKKDMTYKKLNDLLKDIESVWEEFYNG